MWCQNLSFPSQVEKSYKIKDIRPLKCWLTISRYLLYYTVVKMFLSVVVEYQHRVINIEYPQVSIQTLPSPGHQGSHSFTIHSLVSSTLYGHSCSLSHILYHIMVSVILISRYQNDSQEMQVFQATRRCHWKTQGSYFFFFFLWSIKKETRGLSLAPLPYTTSRVCSVTFLLPNA